MDSTGPSKASWISLSNTLHIMDRANLAEPDGAMECAFAPGEQVDDPETI
jgi:hypothetical protein